MMNQRRAQNTGFSIKDIPCPDLKLIDAKDFVTGVTAVGDEVELAANGKLAKKASGTAIGEVVRIYTWNGQQSVMIRFY